MSDDSEKDWFESAISEDADDERQPESDDTEPAESEDERLFDDAGLETEGMETAFGNEADTGSGADGFGERAGNAFGEGESESPFDDGGFAAAFEGRDTDFEDEEFESEIPRIDLGIDGLDEMIQGGIPERHLISAIGGAGTGKTTFALQFLHYGLEQGENAVFFTLEQSRDAIIATATEFGWEFDAFEADDQLAVIDLDPVEMVNSLDNIQSELPELIREFGADRLVIDSVSLLEMMYNDQAKRRMEVYDFTRALKDAGVTTFLTSEASQTNPYASRHGVIEYLTDAVFVLQYVRGETQETRLAIEIQKIRNANHSRAKKPYEMTESGLSVYQQANIF